VKITAGNDPENWANTISNIPIYKCQILLQIFELISLKLGHICTWHWEILVSSNGEDHGREASPSTEVHRVLSTG